MASHDHDLIDAIRRWHRIEHAGADAVNGFVADVGAIDGDTTQLMDAASLMTDQWNDLRGMHEGDPDYKDTVAVWAAALRSLVQSVVKSPKLQSQIASAGAEAFTGSADDDTLDEAAALESGALYGQPAATFQLPDMGDDIPVTVDAYGNVKLPAGAQPAPPGGYRIVPAGQQPQTPTLAPRQFGGQPVIVRRVPRTAAPSGRRIIVYRGG